MDNKVKKSYYAVIPAYVRYDEELTPNAKLLYGEITALCNEKGYCWANNSYFGNLYGVSNRTIARWISSLENKGYVKVALIYEEGTKEVKERRIYMVDPVDKNVMTYGQNCHKGDDKNVMDNNTLLNTTMNTTNDIESSDDDSRSNNKTFYKEIVQAYNDICISLPKVRMLSDKRKRILKATFSKVGDVEKFIEVFKKAEISDFLSGRNGKWNGCNFDWLINYNNFIKVIEGTYDNRDSMGGGDNGRVNNSQNKYGW